MWYAGRRTNTLRQRTDSWVFDMDQLMFGTILFTLLAFICPTTTAYYILFSSVCPACSQYVKCAEQIHRYVYWPYCFIWQLTCFSCLSTTFRYLHSCYISRIPWDCPVCPIKFVTARSWHTLGGLLFALPSKNHLHVCIKQDLTFRILTNTLMIRTIHCIYLIFSANVVSDFWWAHCLLFIQ